jgi:hypothetical protein
MSRVPTGTTRYTTASSEAMIQVSMIRLVLQRLV